MKVLFITHLREQSDWSRTAIDYINAMESAGIDVVVRDVCLNPANRDSKVPMNIAGLEWKPIDDCDVCIQNVLPHLISYSDRFAKNIAMFSVEASTLKDSFWFKPLEMMDEIWVNNNELRTNLIGDGINAKVRFVPPPSDTDSLKSDQKLLEDNTFKFYYIGEILDSSNLESLLKCFHSEFSPTEPVSLTINSTTVASPESISSSIDRLSEKVKTSLRLYPASDRYAKENIITNQLNRDGILALHNSCDCFVSTSHGVSWSRPAFEAMALGKTPILPGTMGNVDFISDSLDTGVLVGGSYDICTSSTPPFPELQTGKEVWFSVSESEFRSWMRHYYNQRDKIDRSAGLKRAKDFSQKNIGNKIKEILE
tara:strand:+ start:295 stop:1398 length:1104 start_codon:yes stop_codon:yes gene_type:complete